MAHDPLRVTLVDLHSAESRGKWWLVGAAWGGDPLAEHQENAAAARTPGKNGDQDELGGPSVMVETALLKLAKKQGMNTDVRRRIFMVLMSSDVSGSCVCVFLDADCSHPCRITWTHAND